MISSYIFYPCGNIMNTSKYSKKLASDIHPTGFLAFGFIFFRPSAWNGKELVISPPPRWFWGTMPRGHACNSMEICCILNRHPKNMWSRGVKHTRPKQNASVKWNDVVVELLLWYVKPSICTPLLLVVVTFEALECTSGNWAWLSTLRGYPARSPHGESHSSWLSNMPCWQSVMVSFWNRVDM